MTEILTERLNQYEKDLEKIITGELPLRDPPITIVKFPLSEIKEIYIQHQMILQRLKTKYPDWQYTLMNIESIFFDLLKKRRFLEKNMFIKITERKRFKTDLKDSVLPELLQLIESAIMLNKTQEAVNKKPPFIVLLNMHATYPFIETKDIISRIINEKGVNILILYPLDPKKKQDEESYKSANYLVHSYALF